eukprot:1913409-Alexandrium_andersonii.AAC.1
MHSPRRPCAPASKHDQWRWSQAAPLIWHRPSYARPGGDCAIQTGRHHLLNQLHNGTATPPPTASHGHRRLP